MTDTQRLVEEVLKTCKNRGDVYLEDGIWWGVHPLNVGRIVADSVSKALEAKDSEIKELGDINRAYEKWHRDSSAEIIGLKSKLDLTEQNLSQKCDEIRVLENSMTINENLAWKKGRQEVVDGVCRMFDEMEKNARFETDNIKHGEGVILIKDFEYEKLKKKIREMVRE